MLLENATLIESYFIIPGDATDKAPTLTIPWIGVYYMILNAIVWTTFAILVFKQSFSD